jgi:hypothetical protein
MTPEQEKECQEHLDALLEITSGIKLSTLLENVQKQMNLSGEEERLVLDVIQKAINDGLVASFAQTGEQLKQLLNNPAMQAEMRAKIDAMTTPKKKDTE